MAIEQLSFATPWQAGAYRYEIIENQLASYQALTVRQDDRPAKLIGYGGYWHMAGEAHISTIAVDPAWRGRGLGELLLLNMLFMACQDKATLLTLEVRDSNKVAQSLYRKYNLSLAGERRRYYRDNNENALIMTIDPLDQPYRHFLGDRRDRLFARLAGQQQAAS